MSLLTYTIICKIGKIDFFFEMVFENTHCFTTNSYFPNRAIYSRVTLLQGSTYFEKPLTLGRENSANLSNFG